jgi:carboxylate-amine ligase
MRTFGVEEELLLVDATTGEPRALATEILEDAEGQELAGFALEPEMQQEMIEVVGAPSASRDELLTRLREGRRTADRLARAHGGRAVALGGSPLQAHPHVTLRERYRAISDDYAAMARATLECGFHVHVGIESEEEGVAVLDRVRVWLPLVLALSANSAFRDGEDTGYASFRFVVWHHWPTAGPIEVCGSVDAYRAFERALVDTGAILDTGMLYFDARLSRHHQTVEVRIADVCLHAEDAATIAGLVRALVDQAAADWRSGLTAPAVPAAVIRLASWMAARHGLRGRLVDPATGRPCAAADVIGRLLDTARPALRRHGDEDATAAGIERILARGTGADRQCAVFAATASVRDVVLDAAAVTLGEVADLP